MALQVTTYVESSQIVVVAIQDFRDFTTAETGFQAFLNILQRFPAYVGVLLDARLHVTEAYPERILEATTHLSAKVPSTKVAVLVDDPESYVAQSYRRGFRDSGHTVDVFTDAGEAEAWLVSDEDSQELYLA